jgi:membrane protein DedA with SNARE-associated domain
MTKANEEPLWKRWLDRLLVLNVFLVLSGALWFGGAVVASSQGMEAPMRQFQKLWDPLFTPAIGLLIAAALVNGISAWWQRRALQAGRDSET